MTTDESILRRHFVAIATSEYDDPAVTDLVLTPEVDAVREWLCSDALDSRKFRSCYTELADNPTKGQIRDRLESPPEEETWRDADAAVVFITGHGVAANYTHYLILKNTNLSQLNRTAIRSADLIGWLAETRIQHLLLILDACYAGQVEKETIRLDKRPPETWLVLPSATKDQEAVTGALTGAIRDFLAELGSDSGEKYGLSPYLTVDDFLEGVQDKLGDGQSLLPIYGSRRRRPHLCLPNPHYRPDSVVEVLAARHDLALPRQDLTTHWSPRARGVASDEEKRWLFTGRAALMQELINAATGAPGATVVAGGAGSGKSAALARLVTLSDERFLGQYADEVASIPDDLRPPLGAVDVAVIATGKLHTQVLAQICAALHVPAPTSIQPEPTVRERLHAWHTWLKGQSRQVTIVVDAVDEAAHPQTLVNDVLAQLEPDPAQPRIRMVLGIRSLAVDDVSGALTIQRPEPVAMADAMQRVLHARRIAVDEAPWWHQHDLADYVASILRHTPKSPYSAVEAEMTTKVAEALGHNAGRSFLIARLAATTLAAQDTVIGADDASWRAALEQGVVGVFRQDLHQSLPVANDRHRAVVLLRAVAFAYGDGLPWRNIWPLVAHAVDDNDGYYGDSDIAWLLNNTRFGAYLIADREDDTTTYRLFHDMLRTTLREHWRDLLTAPTTSTKHQITAEEHGHAVSKDASIVEARIARELARLADVPATTDCDRPPPTYVRRHLAEHAAFGGILNEHIIPNAFLPYLDPVVLRAAASTSAQKHPVHLPLLPAIRATSHLWDWSQPSANAVALSLEAALDQKLADHPIGGPWRVAWASQQTSASEIRTKLTHAENLATAELPDGRAVAIASSGGKILVWDLAAGDLLYEPFNHRAQGGIWHLRTTRLPDGRPVLVTCGLENTIRVWDLTTGAPLYEPLTGHTNLVTALETAILPDRRALAVTSSKDETVRVWDLITGILLYEPWFVGEIWGLTTTTLPDGRAIASARKPDPTPTLMWDLTVGKPLREPLRGSESDYNDELPEDVRKSRIIKANNVFFSATTKLPDERAILVTVKAYSSTPQLWNLATGTRLGLPLTGHTKQVTSLAAARLPDHRTVAITTSIDGATRVWDLAAYARSSTILGTHAGKIEAIATAQLPDNRVVAVTASGWDGTVRVWDLTTGKPFGPPLTGHKTGVDAVATAQLPDNRVVAVTASGWDGTVRMWDLTTGGPVGTPLSGHVGRGAVAATAVLADKRVVAVTAGGDGRVQVRDLATRATLYEPLTGHVGPVAAVATVALPDQRVVAVTGGSWDGTVRVWDLAAGKPLYDPLPGHAGGIGALATAVLPDGTVVVVAGGLDGTVQLWNLATRAQPCQPWTAHTGRLFAIATAVLSNGRIAAITTGDDATVCVYDLATGASLGRSLTNVDARALAVHQRDAAWLVIGGAHIIVAELLHGQDTLNPLRV
ncbi:Uncharacterised protein [Amycolatopsis camponoti]|uniref:Uncharacterized protein n=1 Tax=Amycolatopsis camponoti TaxID=2606593 RepID=A0A6I8LST4_9PSEU|nr:WD40 repeat domain-containing protein [Amycolatopsis camponoti]VVJ19598.1 Uncharacterised protein [Amycolatopsis camponoti]